MLAGRLERSLQDLPDFFEDGLSDVVQREVIDEGLPRDAVADIEGCPVGADALVEEVRGQVARVDELAGSLVRELAVEPWNLPA